MTDENLPANQPPEGQFLLYQTEDGETRIECRLVCPLFAFRLANIAKYQGFMRYGEPRLQIRSRPVRGAIPCRLLIAKLCRESRVTHFIQDCQQFVNLS